MILVCGLSPAWQRILVFERLRLGEVNRARETAQCASGKVINAARAAARLGTEGRAVTILGGATGEQMERSLREEGLAVRAIRTAAPTRTCTTVIDRSTGSITELVENAGPAAPDELAAFREAFREEAREADFVIFTGSLPAGAPPSTYRELVEGIDVPVLADVRGPELLELLPLRPRVAKPNREELGKTLGAPIATDEDLRRAMARLCELGAEWAVVSQGAQAVWACRGGEFHRFQPPRVEAVNPIGSGDSLAGVLAAGLSAGKDPIEAIALGIAAASENAATLLPADIDPARVRRRLPSVTHQKTGTC